ncbi:GNAT family N-acetyltransferase [Actinomadura sp. HBU206391]|uniref:GNAT family N-acetyltransferase n=1 Tax=Actinomadura sp. HBU206391 TaxID=2731692 RepID=UPI00164F1278|nr:GNAT family protein [Actinomadura sp. HBU206391]MBC6456417.1 GNAT family N-acetyltransferase [Actinomadura sp. HBU206391]
MTSVWTGERVRLRGVEPEDWQAFKEFDEHSVDKRSGDMLHPPRSDEGYRRWTLEEAARPPDGDSFRLAIVALRDEVMVGTLNTGDADPRAGHFSYGIVIGHRHQRSGYASEAISILLTFMFGERRYHKCEVGIHAFNEASIALHTKLGFVEEGRLRDHEYFAGRHHDLIMMGLTAEEFSERRAFPDVNHPRSDSGTVAP